MLEQTHFQVPIPGGFFAVITFPGVMMHEISHYIMCKLFKVRVHQLKLFSLRTEHFSFSSDAPVGWVRHEPPKEYYKTFLISIAPILFNTILAILLYVLALQFFNNNSLLLIYYFFIYLGFCCAVNAFPSNGDGEVLWYSAKEELRNHNYLVLFVYPIILIIYIAHYLSMVWLDWIYGGALFFLVASWFGISI
jgi:hypothetical protein